MAMAFPRDFERDFAVIAPSQTEYEAVLDRMRERVEVATSPLAQEGTLGQYRILCVQSGVGQQRATADAAQVLERWNPRYIILAGIAGAKPQESAKAPIPEIRRGDIVLAKYVYCYDYGRITPDNFETRHDFDARPDRSLLMQAERLETVDPLWCKKIPLTTHPETASDQPPRPPRVHAVNMGSGNAVVDNFDRFCKAHSIPDDMLAVEMECAGVAEAIRAHESRTRTQSGFLMIRSISDFIGESLEVRRRWKRYASSVTAAFLESFLQNVRIVEAEEWQQFVERMLDKSFERIKTQYKDGSPSIPEILEKTFGIQLRVSPGCTPVPRPPEGRTFEDTDPYVVFEANAGGAKALQSKMLASKEDLHWLRYYVKPDNYDELVSELAGNKLLILAGEPGVGKTMTALSIVSDFFKRGISPKQGPIRSERVWMGSITTERTEILYLDDPFGRDRSLGRRVLESRKRALLSYLEKPDQEKGYLLVTTRSDRYKDFLDIVAPEIDTFNRLKKEIVTTGYDLESRKMLIDNYSGTFVCSWASAPEAEGIRETAARKITSPLNIKHFCYNTRDTDAKEIDIGEFSKYAMGPLEARGEDLNNCQWGDYLFLVVSALLQGAATNRSKLEELYDLLSDSISAKTGRRPDRWNPAMEARYKLWFTWHESGWCHVVHSTVGNALDKFFRGCPKIQKIIEETFVSLREIADDEARLAAAIGLPRALRYFREAKELRTLKDLIADLVKTEKDHKVRQPLGLSLAASVSSDNRSFFEPLVRQLLKDKVPEVQASVACAIIDNSINCSRKLVEEAAQFAREGNHQEVRRQVAWALASNYRYLTKPARAELKNLVGKENDLWVKISAGEAIADNLEQHEDLAKLLVILLKDPSAFVKRSIVGALEYNLDELPDKLRNKLFELSDENELAVIEWLVWVAMEHFEELVDKQDDKRGKYSEFRDWFTSLAGHENPRVRKWFAEALVSNFEKLDDEYLALLTTLTEDRNEMVRTAACAFHV